VRLRWPFTKIAKGRTRSLAAQFAFLVHQLDSINEGDKKLLDNTATVWFQEMSDGNSPQLEQHAHPPGWQLRRLLQDWPGHQSRRRQG
jgi:hypothetical protein